MDFDDERRGDSTSWGRPLTTLARRVASFYWQLAGVITRDIPLEEDGKPREFERYVGYFIEHAPEFQGPLAETLRKMAVDTYVEAVDSGKEPRAYLRQASRKASALARRTKPLGGVEFDDIPWIKAKSGGALTQRVEGKAAHTVRDTVEALLLDHGAGLVEHMLESSDAAPAQAREPDTEVSGRAVGRDVAADQTLTEWTEVLGRFVQARAQSGQASAHRELFDEFQAASESLVRPRVGPGWSARVNDRAEATADLVGALSGRLRTDPKRALRELAREVGTLPTLVPAEAYLTAGTLLSLQVLREALGEIDGFGDVLAVSTAVLLYALDTLIYMYHVERDGWGDGPEAKAFQDHHDYPDEAGRWTVLRSVDAAGPVVLPFLALLAATQPHFTVAVGPAVALIGLMFVTQTHGLTHVPDEELPGWIRTLQKIQMILPKRPHDHHHDSLAGSYGVFNGWSNPFMNWIGYRDLYAKLRMRLGGDTPIWSASLPSGRLKPTNESMALVGLSD